VTGVTAGNCIRVTIIMQGATTTVSSISDGTNTYILVDAISNGSLSSKSLQTAYFDNAKAGAYTITATLSGSDTAYGLAEEWSGGATSSSLDGHSIATANFPAQGATISSGNFTPTTNGDDIYGISYSNATGVNGLTAGSGFTLDNTKNPPSAGGQLESEDQTQAIAAQTAATFVVQISGGGSGNTIAGIAFKPAVAAAAFLPNVLADAVVTRKAGEPRTGDVMYPTQAALPTPVQPQIFGPCLT